jgi:short-subunit dehydrogenase
MFKKKTTIVPAFTMKALVVLARFIPTKLYVKIAAKQQRKKKGFVK